MIIFSTNKYLFKNYLLTELLNLKFKSKLINSLNEKLLLKLLDLSATIIENNKTKTIYKVGLEQDELYDLMKKIFLILNKTDVETDLVGLEELISQIKTKYVFTFNSISENDSYLKQIWNKLWLTKESDENETAKKRLRLSILKLIESKLHDRISELNLNEQRVVCVKLDEPKCLEQLLNSICKLEEEELANDNLSDSSSKDESFLRQILARNNNNKRKFDTHEFVTPSDELINHKRVCFSTDSSEPFETEANESSMRYAQVEELPGVGPIYAKRLKENSFTTLGDLTDLYVIKCKRNDLLFEKTLKSLVLLKSLPVKKILEIIKDNF